MKCIRFRRAISQYVDGELNPKKQQKLLNHINQCEECRAYLEELQNLKKLAQSTQPEYSDLPFFEKRVMARLRGSRGGISLKNFALQRNLILIGSVAVLILSVIFLRDYFYSGTPRTTDYGNPFVITTEVEQQIEQDILDSFFG